MTKYNNINMKSIKIICKIKIIQNSYLNKSKIYKRKLLSYKMKKYFIKIKIKN